MNVPSPPFELQPFYHTRILQALGVNVLPGKMKRWGMALSYSKENGFETTALFDHLDHLEVEFDHTLTSEGQLIISCPADFFILLTFLKVKLKIGVRGQLSLVTAGP